MALDLVLDGGNSPVGEKVSHMYFLSTLAELVHMRDFFLTPRFEKMHYLVFLYLW